MSNSALFFRLAPFIFVMIWSTGFIAAKYSMANADPFVFLCLRFSITAIVIIPILLAFKFPFPKSFWTHRHDMVSGVLIHCGYLGFVFWPIKLGVPSGIVAIIIGIQPIITMTLSSLYIGEKINARTISGLLIGFVGVAVVLTGKYGLNLGLNGGLTWFEIMLCIISLLCMAIGVFYQKKYSGKSNLFTGTFMQYLGASLATAAMAFVLNESWVIDWTPTFVKALIWQVLGLSIGAVVILMMIIQRGEAGRISSMFYLVPPLVVIEAHFLFGETLGVVSVIGMLMCVAGVYFVNRSGKTSRA